MNIFRKIYKWFKHLFFIVENYSSDLHFHLKKIRHLERENEELKQILRERTQVNAEVSPHANFAHTVVVTGVYKNRDYVEIFHIKTEDLYELVHLFRQMEKHATLKRIDTGPYSGSLRRVFEGELNFGKP